MTTLDETLATIRPIDTDALRAAADRQNTLTKPPGSLGTLETTGNRLAAIAGVCPPPYPRQPWTLVFAGDHGVVAQSVTPWPQEVTVEMAANMATHGACCSVLSDEFGAQLVVTDVGVAGDTDGCPGIVQAKVRPGTRDFTVEPALTRDEARAAAEVGIATVERAVRAGCDIVCVGEMGIGNTTPSAAIIAALTGLPAAEVAGRGAGAGDAMLQRKVAAITRGLELHRPDPSDGIGVLAAVGGLEIAALTGAILAAAAHRVPVVLDGVITAAAALVAASLAPDAQGYLLAGHLGVEPGIRAALDRLGLEPLVDLNLRLGEGSGALLALPLIRASVRILSDMATFEEADVTDAATPGR